MKPFRLAGQIWTVEPDRLSVRASWLSYGLGCVIAVGVLTAVAFAAGSIIADPSITVTAGGYHSRGTPPSPGRRISWDQQTFRQRSENLTCTAAWLVPLTLFSVAYFFIGSNDQRNPLTLDKSNNQIRKGKRVLAPLSAARCIALVQVVGGRPAFQGSTQIFLRFKREPWSHQIRFGSRKPTADRVATVVAEFLAVPIVDDPIVVRSTGRGRPEAPGFPVIPKEPRE